MSPIHLSGSVALGLPALPDLCCLWNEGWKRQVISGRTNISIGIVVNHRAEYPSASSTSAFTLLCKLEVRKPAKLIAQPQKCNSKNMLIRLQKRQNIDLHHPMGNLIRYRQLFYLQIKTPFAMEYASQSWTVQYSRRFPGPGAERSRTTSKATSPSKRPEGSDVSLGKTYIWNYHWLPMGTKTMETTQHCLVHL